MKTDWLRKSLIAGIAIISFLLIIRWNDFQERNQTIPTSVAQSSSISTSSSVDEFDDTIPMLDEADDAVPALPTATNNSRIIKVTTDVLEVEIDTKGGDITKVALPKHFNKIDTPDDPFVLMQNDGYRTYVALSGLVGRNGTDKFGQPRPVFSAARKHYQLNDDAESLNVDLVLEQDNGVIVTKRFTFSKSSYAVTVNYLIDNRSSTPWRAAIYGQIKRDTHNPATSVGIGMQPFLGAATSTLETNYQKFSFSDLAEEIQDHKREGGWVAMVQHYFLSAWIPPSESTNKFELKKLSNKDIYLLQFTSSPFEVSPGTKGEQSVQFYAGPKDIRTLEQISPYLDLTVDYSFLWWIAKPLFYGLDFIHGFVGNWGIAIILLTMVIKAMFFYPSAASYRSMANMRKLQPKLAELKERYGDDKQKFSSEMMKMYRQEKVNPLGGCLPILIQMPVFLALYWVLMESVELRHAPFYLWIEDLSVKDPFYILPLIMGLTMFVQQKLNPTPTDPMQAKIMQMMPIFFTMLMLFFPAGLVLYWVVNNTLSISQQYVITKQIENS